MRQFKPRRRAVRNQPRTIEADECRLTEAQFAELADALAEVFAVDVEDLQLLLKRVEQCWLK